jgi:Ca2+ transporting ATPase
VQAGNNYEKERQFQILNGEAESKKLIRMIRDGVEKDYKLTECLVGDIVIVKGGDEIAGDGVIVEAFSVGCDESALTGETHIMDKAEMTECIRKREQYKAENPDYTNKNKDELAKQIHEVPSPVLMSGTAFQQGSGKMMITCIGMNSTIGRIKKTISDNGDEETPLQKKLTKIAEDIGKFGLVCAILTTLIMIIRAVVSFAQRKKDNNAAWGKDDTSLIVQAFLIGITVLVVAIPEGLPLAVTLSLAYSVRKMLDDQNLVRKLHACETMGGADIICSDKTGTLTMNIMFLTNFWSGESYNIYDPIVDYTTYVDEGHRKIFEQALTCNSLDDPKENSGNPTDLAILKYMLACKIDATETRKKYEKVSMEPFTSDRKRMSTLLADGPDGKKTFLLKGASELITACCEKMLDLKTGEEKPIDAEMRKAIDASIVGYAKQSLRTIGIAYKYVDSVDYTVKNTKGVLAAEESGFTLVGICGIKDVIRKEVPDSVAQCNRAGITVKMVTGDNRITARAIAKECNIINPNEPDDDDNGRVMEGPEFYKLIGGLKTEEPKKKGDPPVETIINGQNFDKIYKKLAVLARSRPEDKYAMVVGLRERGHVVAVTGDGTNDAPALSKANVGFAMGITGTQVAKQAADIMLMDDNFSSIVSAVKWGRNIYDSIRKFLQFQLTVNVVAVIITFISAAVTQEAIMSAVQMLWINMIMDTLASLALATEPPTDALLNRKPNRADDYIVSKKMAKHILGQSVLQVAVMMLFLFAGPSFLPDEITEQDELVVIRNGRRWVRSGLISVLPEADRWPEPNDKNPSRHYTYNFNVFVMLTIFNFLNARKIEDEYNIFKGVFSSYFFPIIVSIIFLLQVLILTVGNIAFRVRWLVSSF